MVRSAVFLVLVALAAPAEARFGKRSSSPPPSAPPPSSSGRPRTYSTPSGRYDSASPAAPSYRASPPPYSAGPPSATGYAYRRPYRAFGYGHGYSYFYQPPLYSPYSYGPASPPMVGSQPAPAGDSAPIRVTVGVEGQGYSNGATLGVHSSFEGERWGVSLSAADIIVRADDGSGGIDHIGDFTAHLTYAFLTGQYGRLRLEAGADAFFAPSIIMVGPTFGMSGVVWFGGPLGAEGSVNVTPWPFTQLDGKLGLVVGVENWGFRAGWRVQALNDRGLVDGIAHGDVFNGPYLGVSYVF